MTENHPLLNKGQFISLSTERGYSDHLASRMFNLIARDWWGDSNNELRASADICYEEVTRDGKIETMISVPNMAANLDRIRHIYGVATDSTKLCADVIDAAIRQC